MLAKHPHPISDETWTPHARSADDSDDVVFTNLQELMDRLDPYVGVGPRGFHAHCITCFNRARMNGLDTEEGAGVQPFRKLGELVLGNVCPWDSRELVVNMLTPLMKHATGNDAQPVSAKDCDYAIWMKSIHRTVVKSESQNVLPQQLGIGVENGGEAKHVMLRMCKEERLATGRGGVVVKDDRINAHNAFSNEKQVLSARAMTGAALFARVSDTQARMHAEIFTRTSMNPSGVCLLTTRKAGGEEGNPITPLQYACCISSALKNVEQRFPEIIVRAIHDVGMRRRSSARGARGSSLRPTSPTSAANFTRARWRRTE
jgi:hypothetical protein